METIKQPLSALAKELERLLEKFPKTIGIGFSIGPTLIFWGRQLGIEKYEEVFNALSQSNIGKGNIIVGDVKEMKGVAFTTDDKKAHLGRTENGVIVFDVYEGIKEVIEKAKNYNEKDAEIDRLKEKVKRLESKRFINYASWYCNC